MAESAPRPREGPAVEDAAASTLADAVASRERILEAAATLVVDRHITRAEIAAAAGSDAPRCIATSRRARRSSGPSTHWSLEEARFPPPRPRR
jgi:hypothetical protein